MILPDLDVPRDLAEFLDRFVRNFPQVQEIWLFGSRADGTSSEASDWDLLVLSGDSLTAEAVAAANHFRRDDYALFIARGNEFRCPWPRSKDGAIESGNFQNWKWRWYGDTAEYVSAKENRPLSTGRAIRVWCRGQQG